MTGLVGLLRKPNEPEAASEVYRRETLIQNLYLNIESAARHRVWTTIELPTRYTSSLGLVFDVPIL